MAKIDNINGARVVIYPNDHRPAHVHIFRAGNEAVIILGCHSGPISLRSNKGFNKSELNVFYAAIKTDVIAIYCANWMVIHGTI